MKALALNLAREIASAANDALRDADRECNRTLQLVGSKAQDDAFDEWKRAVRLVDRAEEIVVEMEDCP